MSTLTPSSGGYSILDQMVPIVCIIGWSGSGKTTLIEGLLRAFKRRGLKVATVKHHPHASGVFPPGKDTTRHLEAGAEEVVLLTPEGLILQERREGEPSLEEVAIRHLRGCDLILAEGFKGSSYPKVEVYREGVGEGFLFDRVKGVIALVTDSAVKAPLPKFRPKEVEPLADFLQGRFISQTEVSLLADGKVVRLNPFVRRLFGGIVEAMVRPLKGCEDVKEAILHWRKE